MRSKESVAALAKVLTQEAGRDVVLAQNLNWPTAPSHGALRSPSFASDA